MCRVWYPWLVELWASAEALQRVHLFEQRVILRLPCLRCQGVSALEGLDSKKGNGQLFVIERTDQVILVHQDASTVG